MSAPTDSTAPRPPARTPETLGQGQHRPRPAPSHQAGRHPRTLPLPTLVEALSVRDLTDPAQGRHALQALVDDASAALPQLWDADVRVERSHPVVALEDNYDRLGYAPDAVSRDARYTRYISDTTMLRSHTSAGIPPALRRLAASTVQQDAPSPAGTMSTPKTTPTSSTWPGRQTLLVLPGICHRRDSIDRIHTGTPHQLDLWLLRRDGRRLDHDDLQDMVATLVDTLLPGRHWRWTAATHPYTVGGRQVDVIDGHEPVEIAECGLAEPAVLDRAGLDTNRWSGLALGMGLDRMLMLRKAVPDIRLLRSADPRIAGQMLGLEPYRPVSDLPSAIRDISIATDPDVDAELLGDHLRDELADDADLVEELAVLSRTQHDHLPDSARRRLEIRPGQVNLLVRLVLRPVDKTLTSDEANKLRDRTYTALHQK